jgi:CubicO group peptidase (beta-lactamase class C family)
MEDDMEKRSRLLVAAALACALALPLAAQTIPACGKTLGVTWQDITTCMNALTTTAPYNQQMKGAVYGYVPPGQTAQVIGSSGNLSSSSILWLGSVSKPFTHIGALLAMQQSGLGLATKFDSLAGVHANLIDGDSSAPSRLAKANLSLGQLLTHTAGFGELTRQHLTDVGFFAQPSLQPPPGTETADQCYARTFGTGDQRFQYVGEPGLNDECVFVPQNPGDPNSPKVWKNARNAPLYQVGQYVMRYPIAPPSLPNGRYPRAYSNVSSLLAGWVTENRTGQTMNNYLRDQLFNPLQLNDTFYNPTVFPYDPSTKLHLLNENVAPQPWRIAHMENMANGLRGNPFTAGPNVTPCNGLFWCDVRDWAFLWPEGGLYSTAGNMLTFLQRFRDDSIPALQRVISTPTGNKTIRQTLLEDLIDPDQSGAKGRTSGFVYARSAQAGDVDDLSEGTVFHGGFPGSYVAYDPARGLGWFFATQRVMRIGAPLYPGTTAQTYFQAFPEQFAEARLFTTMLTSMMENVKPENLNFFFDAARALKRNQHTLRYTSRVDASASYQDAYVGCQNSSTKCDYKVETDYNHCNSGDTGHWYDLSANQRTMSISGSGCAWPGNGSRSENAANSQNGPYRLRVGNGVIGQVSSNLYPNAYTIALWVRPTSTSAASIFSRGGAQTTYQIGIQNGRFVHSSWDTGGKRTVVGDLVVPNQWYYVVGTAVRNGPMTLWINGRRMAGNVTIGDFVSLGNANYFLGEAADGLPRFQGDVAVAAVYTQELAQSDILRNCNGLKYRFPGLPCG